MTVKPDHQNHPEEMRKSGVPEFTASKLGKLKTHLAECGTLRLGATSTEFSNSLVPSQGPGSRGRSTREGCEMSMLPTGEWDAELMRLLNLRKSGFAARKAVGRGDLLILRFYRKADREDTDLLPKTETTVDQSALRDMVSVVRGSSWAGLFAFLFRQDLPRCGRRNSGAFPAVSRH